MTAVRRAEVDDAPEVARLLHDFNTEFSEPTPGVAVLTERAQALLADGEIIVLLGGERPDGLAQLRGEIELGTVLHALSDPMRLKIVRALDEGSGEVAQTCGSFELPVAKSTCTHHFKVLREAGILHQRQQGTTRVNTLRRDDLDSRFPGLLDTVLAASADG